MTKFYCETADAAEVLMAQADSYNTPHAPPTNFWKGIDLIARRLPILNDWLLKVRTGLKPQNESDADRVNEIREKRLQLETANTSVNAALARAKRLIERADSPEVKLTELFKVVAGIARGLAGTVSIVNGNVSSSGGIFAGQGTGLYQYACWLAHGPNLDFCKPFPDSNSSTTVVDFLREIYSKTGGSFDIDAVIRDNWPSILASVRATVLNEFNEIIFIDPTAILTAAHEESGSNMSPRESLNLISVYLHEIRQRAIDHNKRFRVALIDDTLRIVNSAIEKMDGFEGFLNRGGDDGDDDNPLIDIYDLFDMDNGVQFFSDRLSKLVEYDLNDRMKDGELPGDIGDIIRSSNDEILRRLMAVGVRSLAPIKADLEEASGMARSNFEIFRKFMLPQINTAILNLDELSKQYEETLADGYKREYGQRLARLCMLVFSTGLDERSWPSREAASICKASVYFSMYHEPTADRNVRIGGLPDFLARIPKASTRNRMKVCAYYNFLRSERLYEVLHPPDFHRSPLQPRFFTPVVRMSVKDSKLSDKELWQKLIFPF